VLTFFGWGIGGLWGWGFGFLGGFFGDLGDVIIILKKVKDTMLLQNVIIFA
jgi:hypothetical protein